MFKIATAMLLSLLMVPAISASYDTVYAAETRSFIVAGTVFFDADGDGIHDMGENIYAQLAGLACGNSISIPGLAVRIEYPGFSKDYPVSGCGTRGSGVFYETDPIPEGTAIIATLLTPSGYKSTWQKIQTITVQSEQYLSFAVTEFRPEFKITAPNGGEKIEKGATVKIRWNADEQSYINLILYKGVNCEMGINGSVVCGQVVNVHQSVPAAIAVKLPNTGSYDWKVPSNLEGGSDYRVAIQDPNNLPKIDQSDSAFTIISPAKKLPVPKFTACKFDRQCADQLVASCNKGSFQIKPGRMTTVTVNGKNKNGSCLVRLQYQNSSKTAQLKLSATYYIPSEIKSYSDLISHINNVNTIRAD